MAKRRSAAARSLAAHRGWLRRAISTGNVELALRQAGAVKTEATRAAKRAGKTPRARALREEAKLAGQLVRRVRNPAAAVDARLDRDVARLWPAPEPPPVRELPPEPALEATRPADAAAWAELPDLLSPTSAPAEFRDAPPFDEAEAIRVFGKPENVKGLRLFTQRGRESWVRFTVPLTSWADLWVLQRQYYGPKAGGARVTAFAWA